jgi:hypothetical protein
MKGGFVVVNGKTECYLVCIGVGLRDDPTSDACPHTALQCIKSRFKRDYPGRELDFYLWACSECWAIREIVDEVAACA